MIPPKKIEYYFSLVEVPMANQDKSQFSSTFMAKKAIVVPGTNYIDNIINRKSLFNPVIEALDVQPRPKRKFIQGLQRPKTPWDYKKSVFKDYKIDTPEIID